jgi:hypothetical protein
MIAPTASLDAIYYGRYTHTTLLQPFSIFLSCPNSNWSVSLAAKPLFPFPFHFSGPVDFLAPGPSWPSRLTSPRRPLPRSKPPPSSSRRVPPAAQLISRTASVPLVAVPPPCQAGAELCLKLGEKGLVNGDDASITLH